MDNRIEQDFLRRRFKKPVPGHLKNGVEIIPHWFYSEFSSLILLTGTFYFFSETIASLEYSEEEQDRLVGLKEGKESRCQNGRTYDCHKIFQGLKNLTVNRIQGCILVEFTGKSSQGSWTAADFCCSWRMVYEESNPNRVFRWQMEKQ